MPRDWCWRFRSPPRSRRSATTCANCGRTENSWGTDVAQTLGLLVRLVRHGVDDVIHPDPDAEGRKLLVIPRVVGPLPRIAQIHVEADRHHDPALVVVDAAPARFVAVLFP